MVRGPGEGLTVTVSLIGAYKTGGLDLPSPLTDAPLKLYVPCKQCPPMKKGNGCGKMGKRTYSLMKMIESEGLTRTYLLRGLNNTLSTPPSPPPGASYLIMGQVDESRGPVLPADSFVVLYRSNQDQILTNLSKRKCPSQPVRAAGSQA